MDQADGRSWAGYSYSPVTDSGHDAPDERATGAGPTSGVDVLDALRSYRAIETAVRRRLSRRLNVNDTDLSALRYLLGIWPSDAEASPKDLALALSISSASTTLVIDRLENAGFIRRRRHPVDRRAVILEPGEKATEEFRATFDVEKRGVLKAADALTPAETETVTRFLRSMERAIGEAVGPHERPRTP